MKHLKISIEAIPHKSQRYPTVGDYFFKKGIEQIKVSKINAKEEFLIAIHELTEWFLTEQRGIKEKDISKFDKKFEQERKKGLHSNSAEPGFDKRAPYRKEHVFATKVEKMLAKELKINWKKYSKELNKL